MGKRMIVEAFNLRQRMVHILMLKGQFLTNPGLFYGKMGLVIFFAHYHQLTSEEGSEYCADKLMEQIWDEMHKEYPIGFSSGLCGIGWGIEYLIQTLFGEIKISRISRSRKR